MSSIDGPRRGVRKGVPYSVLAPTNKLHSSTTTQKHGETLAQVPKFSRSLRSRGCSHIDLQRVAAEKDPLFCFGFTALEAAPAERGIGVFPTVNELLIAGCQLDMNELLCALPQKRWEAVPLFFFVCSSAVCGRGFVVRGHAHAKILACGARIQVNDRL